MRFAYLILEIEYVSFPRHLRHSRLVTESLSYRVNRLRESLLSLYLLTLQGLPTMLSEREFAMRHYSISGSDLIRYAALLVQSSHSGFHGVNFLSKWVNKRHSINQTRSAPTALGMSPSGSSARFPGLFILGTLVFSGAVSIK